MAVNYDDKRFQQVANEEATALRETNSTYNEMINKSESVYQEQINASKDWADKQTEIQQANTDFAIEKVNQAKDQAKKDYTKEQKAAYTDYQKAINPYGVNAEKLAEQGLQNTGYSESTRTNMYNTYQNRYATARESYNQAVLNYDNSIKEAQLANNAALATIAYEALQKQLELSLQGFQYKNQLVLQKLEAVNQTKDRYYQRWQNVQQQINTENALAEQIRQYNESLAEQRRQYNETMAFNKQKQAQEQANWEKQYALQKASASKSSSSSKSSSGGSSSTKLTNSSSGGSSSLSNNSKSSSSSSSTKLSNNAMQVKKAAMSLANTRTGMVDRSKEFATDYLAAAYKNGKITDSELKQIAKDIGIK